MLMAGAIVVLVAVCAVALYVVSVWYIVRHTPVGEEVFVCQKHGPMVKSACLTFHDVFEFDPDPNWVKDEGTEAFYYCPLCYSETLKWAKKNPLKSVN